MKEPIVAKIVAIAVIAAAATSLSPAALAQPYVEESVCSDDTPIAFHACAREAAQSFEPPRTPIGRPDFNGAWVLPGGQAGGAYEDLEAHPRTRDNLGGPATVVDPNAQPKALLPKIPELTSPMGPLPKNLSAYLSLTARYASTHADCTHRLPPWHS